MILRIGDIRKTREHPNFGTLYDVTLLVDGYEVPFNVSHRKREHSEDLDTLGCSIEPFEMLFHDHPDAEYIEKAVCLMIKNKLLSKTPVLDSIFINPILE